MSKHEEFMRRAIALSRRCMIDNGSAPFAALIVKDGVVVGEGVNNVVNNCDPNLARRDRSHPGRSTPSRPLGSQWP